MATRPRAGVSARGHDAARPAALHVVQVGFDDSVFSTAAASDTAARQEGYGLALDELAPGSTLSLVSVTSSTAPHVRRFTRGNVSFVPAHVPRLRDLPRALYRTLVALDAERRIGVVAAQTVQEDGWVTLAFARRRGVPAVGQVHYDLFSPHARAELFGGSAYGRLRYRASLVALRRFDALRVVGERLRVRLQRDGYRGRLEVLPVPVTLGNDGGDLATGGTGDADARGDGPIVLFVGRAVPQKNLDAWLAVAALVRARVPTARFDVVGGGPELDRIRGAADVLGLGRSIRFFGSVPYEALPTRYRASAVLLVTSHYEGFGRVAVEAYRYGVPVVATAVTGLEDIVDDGATGFLHAPDDHAAMAESVVRLLTDEPMRRAMGRAGRQRTDALYDPAALGRRWMQLLVDTARTRTS